MISGSYDNTIKIWKLDSFKNIITLKGHTHFINKLKLCKDGLRFISASHDTTIRIWNLKTYK
jgi:WD40 repeat protein